MNFRVIKWTLSGPVTTYILHFHAQFYSCFLLGDDRIILNSVLPAKGHSEWSFKLI